jgi:hypothetical protein
VHLDDLRKEHADEREREVAVRDRRAEGALLGALGIDVDPLMIARRVGELVDALLRDLEPVAVAEMLADRGFELCRTLEDCRHAIS